MVLNHKMAATLFNDYLLPRTQWKLQGVKMYWDMKAKCFSTAPLKEYPSQLCAALAQIIISGIDSPHECGWVGVDTEHLRCFADSTSHLYQVLGDKEWGTMRPDWNRS